jgi:predicted transcriptional regulator
MDKLKNNIENEDWWDFLSPAEQEGIQKGLEDIENRNTIPHEEVMKKMKKRVGL